MEPSKDTISSRRDKINTHILGRSPSAKLLINRECLLDALQALFDECSIDSLQKYDRQIAQFAERYKSTISEVRKLRVNITDFEIKDVIGRGHFGEVHVVKEKQTGDVYAMKTIRKCDSLEKTSFDVERDIMAFAESQWITSLQYAFQDSIYLFFVMEYHPGGDLLGLLYRQGGTLPESAATFYLAEILLALEDLHAMGFVHRDLKPDNILLDRCGHLKLADFGSAARFNNQGYVNSSIPVGTPDYIAPEVLQSMEGQNKTKHTYGVSCDFWSLGILAFEMTIGKAPFTGQNTTATYSKIMNHAANLKFPPDCLLTSAYVNLIKKLITDEKSRLNAKQIREHPLFKNVHFDTLRDQVPPYVPKITSLDDTSNFCDVLPKKRGPSADNFKKRTQFSGRNLPFVGFTYTSGYNGVCRDFERSSKMKDEVIKRLKGELEEAKRSLMRSEDFEEIRLGLEKKVMEKSQKLATVEAVREKLERELAASLAEGTALKRTLEIERKDRAELERKALELIKSAKSKWEVSERNKLEALKLEIDQQNEKISQLTATNAMLNDQLRCAFKLENKHKESLEAVEQMNRRSLVGLESKLEKVAVQSRQTIINLQGSMDEVVEEKRELEREVQRLRNSEDVLRGRLEKAEEEYGVLNGAAVEAEMLVKELSQKVGDLEREWEESKTLKAKVVELEEKLQQQIEKVKGLDNENWLLKEEVKALGEYKQQLEGLKDIKTQNEKRINELESKLVEEELKVGVLQKQVVDSNELIGESQQLKELRMKVWKMEKELSNAKIDKRIVDRELKDVTAESKELSEEVKALKAKIEDNRKVHETSMLELNNINENLSLELVKAREALRSAEDKIESERCKNSEEKLLIAEMKDAFRAKDAAILEAVSATNSLKSELSLLHSQLEQSANEKKSLLEELKTSRKNTQRLTDEVRDIKSQLENKERNLEALREACVLIENQVIEYEKIINSIQEEKSKLAQNTEGLISDVCKAKEEIQEAKRLTNEEKSLRLLTETKVKRLKEDLDNLQQEYDSTRAQCEKHRQCASQLSDELTLSEEKVSDLEVTIKSYERQIEDFVSENNILKEEVSQYLTQVAALKESNFKQKQHVVDLKGIRGLLEQRLEELEALLQAKVTYYEEKGVKDEATIRQQTKLIDYLQVKIDEHTHKKKTLTDMLFGHSKKENQPPIILPVNYKELEGELQKQRKTNKELQEEICKLRAELTCRATPKLVRHKSEIASPRTKLAMEQLAVPKQDSLPRMHHNIPHRFVSKFSKKSTKCDHCVNPIGLGREVSMCSECGMTIHTACSGLVKSTCGLPQAYAKHFKNSLTKMTTIENKPSSDSVEGWIKLLSKNNTWDKLFASLTDSGLTVYSNSDKQNVIESLDFQGANTTKKVVLEPVASELGVNVANSDLPFTMKVEVRSDCWPAASLVFMALSMEERDKWYRALKTAADDDVHNLQTIVGIPDQIYVNCFTDISKGVSVLGTDQGLYSHHNGVLLHIEGPSEVHNICRLPDSNVIVMIAGITRVLISCDLQHLVSVAQCAPCTKPVLRHENIAINNLEGFHYLEPSSFGKHQMFCAATAKQLVIVKYVDGQFAPLRIMDTAEPLGCALFTEHSLIVGADKFFEIDLLDFKAEEFLDSSDGRLKPALKCHKIQSYPVGILEVSDNPKEYLLCFNEFSVFVDEYGRCSRDSEVRTNYLPLGFHYIKPYLYIVQFSGVEVMRLGDGSQGVSVGLKKVRYLGRHKGGLYVFHEGKVKVVEGHKVVEGDDCSTSQSEEASERFSFTSSMVQSLDGHMSDTENSSEDNLKRVRFSQTNL